MKDIRITNAAKNYSGQIEVSVTPDNSDKPYKAYMTMEEYKLRAMLIAIAKTIGPLVARELEDAIDDYGQERYSEGYDSAAEDC